MYDDLYINEVNIASKHEDHTDLFALSDLKSPRRIPWEDDIPFVRLHFGKNELLIFADGRCMIREVCRELSKNGYNAQVGSQCTRVANVLPLT